MSYEQMRHWGHLLIGVAIGYFICLLGIALREWREWREERGWQDETNRIKRKDEK